MRGGVGGSEESVAWGCFLGVGEKETIWLDRIKDVLEAVGSEILRGERNREKALGILGWPFGKRRDHRPVEGETGLERRGKRKLLTGAKRSRR
jgi:hypothetical protein